MIGRWASPTSARHGYRNREYPPHGGVRRPTGAGLCDEAAAPALLIDRTGAPEMVRSSPRQPPLDPPHKTPAKSVSLRASPAFSVTDAAVGAGARSRGPESAHSEAVLHTRRFASGGGIVPGAGRRRAPSAPRDWPRPCFPSWVGVVSAAAAADVPPSSIARTRGPQHPSETKQQPFIGKPPAASCNGMKPRLDSRVSTSVSYACFRSEAPCRAPAGGCRRPASAVDHDRRRFPSPSGQSHAACHHLADREDLSTSLIARRDGRRRQAAASRRAAEARLPVPLASSPVRSAPVGWSRTAQLLHADQAESRPTGPSADRDDVHGRRRPEV